MADDKPSSDRPSARPFTAAPQTPPPGPEFPVPAGGVVEGRAYLINGDLVIAGATVNQGAKVASVSGVVEYAKVHEEAWKAGEDIFWCAAGACMSNSVRSHIDDAENRKVGVADKDATRPSATGFVRLDAHKN